MEADDTKSPCLILRETSDRIRNAKPKFHRCLTAGCRTLNVLLSFSQFEREVTGETVKACHGSGNGKGVNPAPTLPRGLAGARARHLGSDRAGSGPSLDRSPDKG
jgi:hypothetical protein